MKRRISLITLALVFGFFCTTLTWAGNGNGIGTRDGSMLNLDLTDTITVAGIVESSSTAGSGLTIDEGNGVITTVYGMGPLSFWESLEVAKPTVGESVAIDAVEVIFSDGTTRLIAVNMTIDDTFITLRTDDGPSWRGINKGNGGSANGSGVCPLTAD